MTAFCDNCMCEKSNDRIFTREIEEIIKDVQFKTTEKYTVCPTCGEIIYTDEMIDENVSKAHDDYRKKLNRITVREISELLERYNIGAQPLSKLLGWGENSIERMMKHTIPEASYSDKLKSLFDAKTMNNLLLLNGSELTDVAYKKVRIAIDDIFRSEMTINEHDKNYLFSSVFPDMNDLLFLSEIDQGCEEFDLVPTDLVVA